MKKNYKIESKIVTAVVYILSIYICFLVIKPIVYKTFDNSDVYHQIKYIFNNNLPILSYEKNHSININQTKSPLYIIDNFAKTPVMEYTDENNKENVANSVMGSYLTDEEDEKEHLYKNHFYIDGDENTNETVAQSNEQPQEQQTTEIVQAQVNPETIDQAVDNQSGMPVKKKELHIEDLTYDYLIRNFYTVVSSTSLNPEDIDASKLMSIDMKMKQKNDAPQILIYHTHGQEAFSNSDPNNPQTRIVGVGDYLAKLLTQKYGYNVIHLEDSFDNVNGVLDRHKAYDYAYDRVSQVLADNPSIEVVLDIHRDGVDDSVHLVTEVDGKPTAKIMFFNGISRLNSIGEIGYLFNPFRTENLALSLQMKVLAEEYYEGFTRKTYIQAYQYNLHMRAKSMLIEVGAQTNTYEEAYNAMEPLAALLRMELQ